MLDSRDLGVDTKAEYTFRQLQEIEWIVSDEIHNTFPNSLMMPLLLIMSLLTVVIVFFTSLMASSLTPDTVGRWFGLHGIVVAFWILVMEPVKVFWYMDVGSQDSAVPGKSMHKVV